MAEYRLYPYSIDLRNLHGFETGAVTLYEKTVTVDSPFEPHHDGKVYPLRDIVGRQDCAVDQFLRVGLLVTPTDATNMSRGQVFPVVDILSGTSYHARVAM